MKTYCSATFHRLGSHLKMLAKIKTLQYTISMELWCFKEAGHRKHSASTHTDESHSPHPSHRSLCCAQCMNAITDESHHISQNGNHRHTFANPGGEVYQIGCYSTAINIHIAGTPSAEFTWFPGYRWQIVSCALCHLHLGWQFTAADTFYGFILDRLIPTHGE